MQIIEHSIIGTRSAVLRFKRRDSELRFVLFPMIHVASPRFYRDVTKRLRECDLLVVEGVKGRSALGSAITLTYRIIPANRRSGLVAQNEIDLESLGVPIICPDVSAAEFAEDWRRMPLKVRLLMWCLIPVVTVMQLVGGRRRLLTPDIEVSDLPTAQEERFANDEFDEHLDRAFLTRRDRLVLETLAEIHRTRSTERIEVGVLYGAGHMPGIVDGLLNGLGYRARDAEWITVLEA